MALRALPIRVFINAGIVHEIRADHRCATQMCQAEDSVVQFSIVLQFPDRLIAMEPHSSCTFSLMHKDRSSTVPESKDFKIIPEDGEMSEIDRDLTFHEVQNDSPGVLTQEQIAAFNKNGYLRPFEIFDKAEITELRNYFDALLERVIAEGGDSYSISTAHMKYGRVYDLLTNEKIVSRVKDLLGDDVIGWGSHFFCKMPHDGQTVAWHQDASYWPLSPSRTVTVWLAVDDASTENACMRFISGSHHFGHMTYRPSSPDEHNVLDQTIENVEQYGTAVDDELKAGEMSIHADLLLHGSEANESDRRRCGLTLRYCSVDVRAHLGWNEKGVIVSGSDPSGHWGNPPRPTAE